MAILIQLPRGVKVYSLQDDKLQLKAGSTQRGAQHPFGAERKSLKNVFFWNLLE
jgi:hypothetical protein